MSTPKVQDSFLLEVALPHLGTRAIEHRFVSSSMPTPSRASMQDGHLWLFLPLEGELSVGRQRCMAGDFVWVADAALARRVVPEGRAQTRYVEVTAEVPSHVGRLLLELLHPSFVVRREEPWAETLERTRQLIVGAIDAGGWGLSAFLAKAFDLLLIQTFRARLSRPSEEAGWLALVADPDLGRAVEALHRDLAKAWTVSQLARLARMSRSGFHERFRACSGRSPLAYLRAFRMGVAADLLASGQHGLASVAAAVGYQSETAFARAFKQERGVSPGAVARKA